MRTPRAIAISEIMRRTRLTEDEVRRYNPALRTQVPAHARCTFRSTSRNSAPTSRSGICRRTPRSRRR